jgi:hypothetical protein
MTSVHVPADFIHRNSHERWVGGGCSLLSQRLLASGEASLSLIVTKLSADSRQVCTPLALYSKPARNKRSRKSMLGAFVAHKVGLITWQIAETTGIGSRPRRGCPSRSQTNCGQDHRHPSNYWGSTKQRMRDNEAVECRQDPRFTRGCCWSSLVFRA